MRKLTPEQELTVSRFHDQLSVILGPDDMFPPDNGGDREPLLSPLPVLPACEEISIAAVYNLLVARRRREQIGSDCGQIIMKIDQLIGG